jgi:bacterial/archaeal transporter family-2 protein
VPFRVRQSNTTAYRWILPASYSIQEAYVDYLEPASTLESRIQVQDKCPIDPIQEKYDMRQGLYILLALFGGALLAGMVTFNSQLYLYVNPFVSSWIAHGVGAIAALAAVSLIALTPKKYKASHEAMQAPWWAYLGGLPGSFVVILAVITVNGYLGITGTLVMSIVGQVLYGLLNDHWGWFGFPKRKISFERMKSVASIVLGAVLIIYARGALQ